jgi:hypothetical protein
MACTNKDERLPVVRKFDDLENAYQDKPNPVLQVCAMWFLQGLPKPTS